MINRLAIFSVLTALALLAPLTAEVKQTYGLDTLIIGADAMGRGGAYLAADDSNHYAFQNYSFLDQKISPRISLTVFKLINEINYLSAVYSQDRFSLGFLNIQDSGGYLRDAKNNLVGGKIAYRDTTLYGAYAFQYGKLNFAPRLKYYSKAFSQVDTSAWGLSLDLAGSYRLNDYWTFGAEITNILGTTLHWSDDFDERFPLSFAAGSRFKAFGPEGFFKADFLTQPLDLYADVRLEEQGSFVHTGAEYWFSQHVALRLGVNQTYDIDDNNRDSKYTKLVAGLGFNWHNIYFDYAYNPGDDIAGNVTHFFTLAYRFGTPTKDAEPAQPTPTIATLALEFRPRLFDDLGELPPDDQLMIEDIGYLGFMIGYPGRVFRPLEPLTRRELMLVLVRLSEHDNRYPDETARYFPDLTPDEKEWRNMDKASRYGLLRGYTDGLARLAIPARRDEAAGAFARYRGFSGENVQIADVYEDVPANHWAYKDINLTKQYLLTIGVGEGRFDPKQYMRRIDAARILSRLESVQRQRVDLPPLVDFDYDRATSGNLILEDRILKKEEEKYFGSEEEFFWEAPPRLAEPPLPDAAEPELFAPPVVAAPEPVPAAESFSSADADYAATDYEADYDDEAFDWEAEEAFDWEDSE